MSEEDLDFELCPDCRNPLQGRVCRCGCNVGEVEWDYCSSCHKPTLEEDLEREIRRQSIPGSMRRVSLCPDCR